MQIGSTPNEFNTRAVNQQNTQFLGRLPNWQSRLGVGTAGGGINLNSLQSQNGALGGEQSNLPMMIQALLSTRRV